MGGGKDTRQKTKNKNTPEMSPQRTPPSTAGSSSTRTPAKKTKARSSSLEKVSEAISILDNHIRSLDGEIDPKLVDSFNHVSAAIKEISKHYPQ